MVRLSVIISVVEGSYSVVAGDITGKEAQWSMYAVYATIVHNTIRRQSADRGNYVDKSVVTLSCDTWLLFTWNESKLIVYLKRMLQIQRFIDDMTILREGDIYIELSNLLSFISCGDHFCVDLIMLYDMCMQYSNCKT